MNKQGGGSPSTRNQTKFNYTGASQLVNKLRQADLILAAERQADFRDRAIELRPEIRQAYDLEKSISKMFTILTKELQSLSQHENLSKSYIRLYEASQVIWDDISQENKAKLIFSIRQVIEDIFIYIQRYANANVNVNVSGPATTANNANSGNEEKLSDSSNNNTVAIGLVEQKALIIQKEQTLRLLMERTDVKNESKEFEDFHLEDLYDLITECINSLELIRLFKNMQYHHSLTSIQPDKDNHNGGMITPAKNQGEIGTTNNQLTTTDSIVTPKNES